MNTQSLKFDDNWDLNVLEMDPFPQQKMLVECEPYSDPDKTGEYPPGVLAHVKALARHL
jgi:hypothetical protein